MSGKKLAILGAVIVLVLGGAAFGIYTWKMNAYAFQGISLSMQGVPEEHRERWTESLKAAAEREEILKLIVKEGDYQSLMGVDGEEAAVADLKSRIKIDYRERKGTLEVGMTGVRKEVEALKKIAPVIHTACAQLVIRQDQDFHEFLSKKGQ